MPEMPFGHVNTPKIWNGTCTWQSGVTPFGWYDDDPQFQDAAVKFSFFAARRLGWPILDVELDSGSFFTCLEEAVTEYGNQIYQFKVRENYLSMEGGSTAIPANKMVVEPTLQRIVEISKNYGTEAVVGGNITLHTGFLDLTPGQQDYNLNEWAAQEGIVGGIEIRKVFWEAPPAILRYFDPYAGTGTGIQSLMDAFDFGSYSPGVNFLLMPISYDLLKIQAIEFNDQVRKSTYSFRVSNNQLQIFPIPTQGSLLRIEYYKLSDKRKLNPKASNYGATSVHKISVENWVIPEGQSTEWFSVDISTLNIDWEAGDSVAVRCYLETTVDMKTTANKIGYVAAFPLPECIRGINAFTLGVQSVNPNATVEVKWTNTWYDPAVEKQAALDLLNGGCDVLEQHQDSTAAQLAAQEKGAFAIGYNTSTPNAAPAAYLTAPLFHWEVFYKDDVDAILNGTWTSRAYWEGLSSGMVSLDNLTALCAPGTQEAVDKMQSKIADGSCKIYAGPLSEQDRNRKVAEGTTMTDDEVWNMGWFVKGVIGTIPQN